MTSLDGDAGTLVRCRQEPPRWEYRDLVIRRYTAADHQAVLQLHRQGLKHVGLRPGDGVYYEYDLFRIPDIYLRAGGEFLVGERHERVLAMGGLRRADLIPAGATRANSDPVAAAVLRNDETGEMVRLRVHGDMHRRGYGAAIASALEERAIELGFGVLHGDTTELQGAAIALYRRMGWKETRRETIGGIVNIFGEKLLR